MGGALALAAATRDTGICNIIIFIRAAAVAYYGIPDMNKF